MIDWYFTWKSIVVLWSMNQEWAASLLWRITRRNVHTIWSLVIFYIEYSCKGYLTCIWYSKERVHDDYQAIEYVVLVMFRLCYSLMSIVLIITYMTSLYMIKKIKTIIVYMTAKSIVAISVCDLINKKNCYEFHHFGWIEYCY